MAFADVEAAYRFFLLSIIVMFLIVCKVVYLAIIDNVIMHHRRCNWHRHHRLRYRHRRCHRAFRHWVVVDPLDADNRLFPTAPSRLPAAKIERNIWRTFSGPGKATSIRTPKLPICFADCFLISYLLYSSGLPPACECVPPCM